MRWTDLRKLEVGDIIVYGDHQQPSKCSFRHDGEIMHVTVKGGIKVRVLDFAGEATGDCVWVPYHHVISFPRCHRKQRSTAA